jgi:hypothetical protein
MITLIEYGKLFVPESLGRSDVLALDGPTAGVGSNTALMKSATLLGQGDQFALSTRIMMGHRPEIVERRIAG